MNRPKLFRLTGVLVLLSMAVFAMFRYAKHYGSSVGIPPWQATPANTPKVPDGFVPAWKDPTPAPDRALKPPPLMPLPADARPADRRESKRPQTAKRPK